MTGSCSVVIASHIASLNIHEALRVRGQITGTHLRHDVTDDVTAAVVLHEVDALHTRLLVRCLLSRVV